jgi:hypothetical protein
MIYTVLSAVLGLHRSVGQDSPVGKRLGKKITKPDFTVLRRR